MKASVIFISCFVAVVTAQDFTCVNPETVNFYGKNLTCPEGLTCNSKNKITTGSPKPKPCVTPSLICDYSCLNDSTVVINTVPFNCAENESCNKDKTSCSVCLEKQCDKNAWTCKNDDKSQFWIGKYPAPCPATKVCNADYKYPCEPCVEDTSQPGNGNGGGNNGGNGDGNGGGSGNGGTDNNGNAGSLKRSQLFRRYFV